ncbi:ATP-dependent helicase [Xanthomonas sp. WHRI 10064A]|uniref:ATP-dependent helicase n=1 Tax=unclassified Xanthomonas TaxID=2643310 RepID=UPI002B2304C8|nr:MULTISPECIES: ATP-dependent helicase [unclassified Xanthomonas]MEA9585884.1 ATP-dependent helicase [Xanthomonas sp. WHRI 10064B]MEA9614311.1 ATP-dependent helicase [Xanthomonas sp. WHRI 10064A]
MSDRAAYLHAASQMRGNPGQWAAYESHGHCVVLAGPGSGKTKALTTKMARMLAEDVQEPRGIACITYNNECARELEDRLAALGVEPGGRVFIGTVHSFSLTQIVLPYAKAARLGLPEGFGVATRAERQAALAEAVARTVDVPGNPQDWDFRLGNHRRSILNCDSAEWRETDPELSELAEAYEMELRRRGLIDFDDMPLLALRALRDNPWLQQALLAKYPILVVDEYQDLGVALHRMVMGLCFRAGMRLFAVGDIDQSIYGFTGARPELLRRLSEREDVETVRLRLNYRSGNRIINASGVALGEQRDYEAADATAQGTVFIHPLGGTYEQQAARLLGNLLPQSLARHPGLSYQDVAVLYPAAWIGDAVAGAAQAAGIPIARTDGNALYPRSSRLMQWLELCGQWCCGGWRTGEPRFTRLVREGRRLFAETLQNDERFADFHRRLIAVLWGRRDAGLGLHNWLEALRADVIEPLALECVALRDELETLSKFSARVAPAGDRADMALGELAGDGEHLDRLTLSTLHSAKGREFGVVFLFGMDVGRLPRNGGDRQQLAEARRLFYVGFTRAKAEVHLVYTTRRVSPFVEEIEQHLAGNE